MSLGPAHVKEEPEYTVTEPVFVKQEATDTNDGTCIKEESDWTSDFCGVSEAAARAGLYIGHQVKDDLVLGPVSVQRPRVLEARELGGWSPAPPRNLQFTLRECSVRLTRLPSLPLRPPLPSRPHCGAPLARTRGSDHVFVKQEATDTYDGTYIKEESDWTSEECGISEAAARAGLYTGHQIKGELVSGGPESVQRPRVLEARELGDWSPAPPRSLQFTLRECSVRLTRLPPLPLRRPLTPRPHCGAPPARTRGSDHEKLKSILPESWVRLERCAVPSGARERSSRGHDKAPRRTEKQRANTYTCDICSMTCTLKSNLIKHINLHLWVNSNSTGSYTGKEPLTCNICQATLSCVTSLKRHMRIHTHKNVKVFTCDICKKMFREKSCLKRHILIHSVRKPQYPCEICKKVFSTRSNLKNHEQIHTGIKSYTCNTCEKKFTRLGSLQAHLPIHLKELPYTCEICNKSFCSMPRLKFHKLVHSTEKPYTCETCKKKYPALSKLNRHKRFHSDIKPFKCDKCTKSFRRSTDLKYHIRTHTGEKPFACDICSKKFTAYFLLTKHKRTHSGEKPYACYICKKRFTESINLKYHMRLHTGEMPYSCEICQKMFSEPRSLRKHKKTYPVFCETCKEEFKTQTELDYHKIIHTGNTLKPYSCGICKGTFPDNASLKKHKKTHKEEKPFSCEICKVKFKQWAELNAHKITHENRSH